MGAIQVKLEFWRKVVMTEGDLDHYKFNVIGCFENSKPLWLVDRLNLLYSFYSQRGSCITEKHCIVLDKA